MHCPEGSGIGRIRFGGPWNPQADLNMRTLEPLKFDGFIYLAEICKHSNPQRWKR